jgi:hypothetical protein
MQLCLAVQFDVICNMLSQSIFLQISLNHVKGVGGNSLKPQARVSFNYGTKEYLALLPSFCALHASLLENTVLLEISFVSCIMCLPGWSVLPGTLVYFCLFVYRIPTTC